MFFFPIGSFHSIVCVCTRNAPRHEIKNDNNNKEERLTAKRRDGRCHPTIIYGEAKRKKATLAARTHTHKTPTDKRGNAVETVNGIVPIVLLSILIVITWILFYPFPIYLPYNVVWFEGTDATGSDSKRTSKTHTHTCRPVHAVQPNYNPTSDNNSQII